jgi:hypothetical protein
MGVTDAQVSASAQGLANISAQWGPNSVQSSWRQQFVFVGSEGNSLHKYGITIK